MSLDAINDAVKTYHDLLTEQIAHDTYAQLNQEQLNRRLYFGTRAICTVLRPQFYMVDQWAYLKYRTQLILSAFAKAHKACVADEKLRRQLDLEPYEEELFRLDIGFDPPWTTARLDAFFILETNNLHFLEYNAETPAGMGYGDQLAEAFYELEPMRQFKKHYHVFRIPMEQSLLDALIDVYHQWGGKHDPQIGIIDWSDVSTINEHLICQDYFAQQGVKSKLADPRILEYRNGHLWAGDFRIDLIYKRVLSSELIHRMGMDNPIVRALKDRTVVMTNAFSAKLMAKKASFALLSDEQNAHLFDVHEREAIEAHIPWTRRVEERRTRYHGQEIDLLPFIADNRERLVLKPNDEYGGSGVVLGKEATPEEWSEALKKALTTPYVVQERVEINIQDFPAIRAGKLDISSRMVDTDPYIFFGKRIGGCLTRLSSQTLLNVTAGGGSVVPTFIIQKK
jgi:uncharacterized circularly permuted ATP-grasp superfamily protein